MRLITHEKQSGNVTWENIFHQMVLHWYYRSNLDHTSEGFP